MPKCVIICLTNLSSRRHLTQIFLLRSFHPASAFWSPAPRVQRPGENVALGKFSGACKCIFISNHHLFLQCTTCLSVGIHQHSNTQTQDQTSDSKGLGSRYKCMCIFQVECVIVSMLCSKNYYFNGQLFMNAQHNIRCYMHEMMMPIGIYKQDQRGFHSTTEGNSIYRLIFY